MIYEKLNYKEKIDNEKYKEKLNDNKEYNDNKGIDIKQIGNDWFDIGINFIKKIIDIK